MLISRKMINYKRFWISIFTGAVLGVICIVGVGQRTQGTYLENIVYLLGIWGMRVILGIIIGLAEGIIIIKGEQWQKWVNASIRGIVFGLITSTAVLLMDYQLSFMTFGAGIAYGLIIDLVATWLGKKKKE